ncbi:hypothetical protein [uncultured Methanobrevibacter sp.]|uniref:hypothetical protein n=1 Tax=uncultured Methanobrevibacter sp. TaxID=253161 RepID=UPI0026242204|nr:hypothetical protein [uncultured Methanobrevibacter sp.]
MDFLYIKIIEYFVEIAVFMVLMVIASFLLKKIMKSRNKIFNPREYFPEEEIHSLRQVFYLIMMAACFINILYSLVFVSTDVIYLVIFDILLSLFVAIRLDRSILKNKILIFLLVPYGSLTYLLFGNTLVGFLDFLHVPIFIYIIKIYYDKFREYTESNGLGIAIILLFMIVFISFLATQVAEGANALDSLVMVSNAFTSNGYAVLGNSIAGKLDAIVLVWAGYILSGVGTATLTAAILTKHFNSKFEELEELIKKNNEE